MKRGVERRREKEGSRVRDTVLETKESDRVRQGETPSHRDKETKRQRDKETQRYRDTEIQRHRR